MPNWLDYAVFVCVPVSRDKDWLEGHYSCGYKGASCSHVDVSASSGTVEEIGRGGEFAPLCCVTCPGPDLQRFGWHIYSTCMFRTRA
jgi:hypothetical protein